MKFFAFLSLICLTLSLTFSCDQKKAGGESGPQLGDTLSLYQDQAVVIGPKSQLQLTMTQIRESRCPKGTSCIRAGEAIATLQLQKGDEEATIDLEAKGNCMEDSGKCGNSRPSLGYTVQLLNIYPYPGAGQGNKYAKVIVTQQ